MVFIDQRRNVCYRLTQKFNVVYRDSSVWSISVSTSIWQRKKNEVPACGNKLHRGPFLVNENGNTRHTAVASDVKAFLIANGNYSLLLVEVLGEMLPRVSLQKPNFIWLTISSRYTTMCILLQYIYEGLLSLQCRNNETASFTESPRWSLYNWLRWDWVHLWMDCISWSHSTGGDEIYCFPYFFLPDVLCSSTRLSPRKWYVLSQETAFWGLNFCSVSTGSKFPQNNFSECWVLS